MPRGLYDRQTSKKPKRKTSRAHPLMVGRERGVWHPDLAGKIRGYALTQEDFDDRREAANHMRAVAKERGTLMTRKGVPDGWAKQRPRLEEVRAMAKEEARQIMAKIKEYDGIDAVDERAEECVEAAIEIVRAKDPVTGIFAYTVRDRMTAMALIAKYGLKTR